MSQHINPASPGPPLHCIPDLLETSSTTEVNELNSAPRAQQPQLTQTQQPGDERSSQEMGSARTALEL